jgi:hypothetical protein
MMADDATDKLTAMNRVSIRAVLAAEGEDVTAALAQAGILNPVAIPVLLGEDAHTAGAILGDGITPNLTGVLEPDDEDAADQGGMRPMAPPGTRRP